MTLKEAIEWAESRQNVMQSLTWFVKPLNDGFCVVNEVYAKRNPEQYYIYDTKSKIII